MTKFDTPEVIAALEEIVAGREDYVYELVHCVNGSCGDEQCMYSTKSGEPSCVVGCVVEKLAPEVFTMLHEFEWGGEQPTSNTIRMLAVGDDPVPVALRNTFTDEAIDVLGVAQLTQDVGDTWGQALKNAKSVL